MKKYFYFSAVIIVFAIAAFNVLTLQMGCNMSQLRLANIEALSDEAGGGNPGGSGESSEWGCGGVPTFIPNKSLNTVDCKLWGLLGEKLMCTDNTKVCCDPSKQTICPPIKL